jgi:Probable molybdopterin binding domain
MHINIRVFNIIFQIRDSNRAMLLAAATQQKCKIVDFGIAKDEEESLNNVFNMAFSSDIDILLTSGGVSMGDKDFVKPCLAKRGTIYFEKVVFIYHLFVNSFCILGSVLYIYRERERVRLWCYV